MPKIPVYEKQVARNRLNTPNTYQRGGATAASFGGNEARNLGNLANAMGDVGRAVNAYERYRDRKDATIARNKKNEIESNIFKYFESDVYARQGENAFNIAEEADKYLDDLNRDVSDELENDNQREYFKASFAQMKNSYLNRAIRHQENERKKFEIATLDVENSNAIKAATLNKDPESIQEMKETIIANTAYKYKGMGKGVINKAIADSIHAAHTEVLSSYLESNPEAGKEYFEANIKEFNPAVRDKLKGQVTELADRHWVEEKAKELSGTSLEAALREIETVKDEKKKADLSKRIKEIYKDKENLKALADKESYEKVFDQIDKDPYSKIPSSLPANLQKDLIKFAAWRKQNENAKRGIGRAVKSDRDTYLHLLETPRENLKEELTKNAHKLSDSDFRAFAKKATSPEEYESVQTINSYMTKLQKDMALDKDERAYFASLFETELNKYPPEERKKVETYNKIKDQLCMEMDVRGSFFDSPYWKARFEGKEIKEPDDRPDSVPKQAKWVDKMIGKKLYRGWEYTNPEGQTYIYIDGKPYLKRRKGKMVNR